MNSLSERPVYLISDLHLEAGRPDTTRLLLDFLQGPVRRAQALYILGDLFEAWIGDDGADVLAAEVADALSELAGSGLQIHFLHGNRDFLVGPGYCARAGMRLRTEPVLLPDIEPGTALLHGDVLCTDDHDYQRFRRKVRDPAWQSRMLARPLWWRRLLGRLARSISRHRNRDKPAEIMDVNDAAVRRYCRESGVRRLIHGHTHRPGMHRFEVDGQTCERIVLGDWHGERGSVIELDGPLLRLLDLGRDEQGLVQLSERAAH